MIFLIFNSKSISINRYFQFIYDIKRNFKTKLNYKENNSIIKFEKTTIWLKLKRKNYCPLIKYNKKLTVLSVNYEL